MKPGDVFLVSNQGDGWWDCPSPLTCLVVDGPAPIAAMPDSTYLLVKTDAPIQWQPNESFVQRWGPDHPASRPIEPTHFLLLLSSHAPHDFTLNLDDDGGIPAHPVIGDEPRTVNDADGRLGSAAKVSVRRQPDR